MKKVEVIDVRKSSDGRTIGYVVRDVNTGEISNVMPSMFKIGIHTHYFECTNMKLSSNEHLIKKSAEEIKAAYSIATKRAKAAVEQEKARKQQVRHHERMTKVNSEFEHIKPDNGYGTQYNI